MTKNDARIKLTSWNKLPLTDPLVIAWVRQVLGYFANCYKGQGDQPWNASILRIAKIDPMLNIDLHAGVNLIRKYYPEFVPTANDFNNAKWGN